MRGGAARWSQARVRDLRIRHVQRIDAADVCEAIERHRRHVARGRDACESWGPGSSVSRVRLAAGLLDLAVKWNHPRGLRGALGERLWGSRARRAAAGAERLRRIGLVPPETLAVAERRRLGLVLESFLLTGFLADALPLPAAMPELRGAPRRRRALARALGETLGELHAGGLDHRDLKHSNLLLRSDGSIVLLDLDSLAGRRRPGFRQRVRALGQLEAYAVDLYPWLPRSDRLRFLGAYLRHAPELQARRRELVRAVAGWVRRRLAEWGRKDRRDHHRFPLAPRRAPGARDIPPPPPRGW